MTKHIRGSAAGLSILCAALGPTATHAQEGAAVTLPDVVVSATPIPVSRAKTGSTNGNVPARTSPTKTAVSSKAPVRNTAARDEPITNVPPVIEPVVNEGNTGISINKVPANITVIGAKEFAQRNSPSVADTITARVAGAVALNVDGSDLSPDLFYRGFNASRIGGTAQGLAVFQNGVRINEVFGDNVNLDLIPPIAIARSEVYTNNPVFGLNALGGAINFTMKNGFTYQGGEASVYGGSYGRVDGQFQYGKQSGTYSFYIATDALRDGGYRPFGASNLERVYADLGYRSQDAEVHAIGSFGRSLLGVQGTTPNVLVQQQYNAVFTTPQTTNNQSGQFQLTGRYDITPHWTLSASVYVRQFDQIHVDGNDSNLADCAAQGADPQYAGFTCSQGGGTGTDPNATVLRSKNGNLIPYLGDNFPYGTTSNTSTHSTSGGGVLQATNKDKIYGHDNYFVVGGSVDLGTSHFNSTTTIGQLNAQFQNITTPNGLPGIGEIAQTQGRVGYSSVFVGSTTQYYGVFALDTFNLTKELALTAGARLNIAKIGLNDFSGLDNNLNNFNTYTRLNPVVGATYTFNPSITVYAGYSESNRAPVPLESACADPQRPCTLENALVSDPPLQQVVGHTVEAGARGVIPLKNSFGALSYKAGYFRTSLTNDILSVPSIFSGQGYFVNVPETLRQGAEVSLEYDHGPWSFYGNYAYVDATYQFSGLLSSPNNPSADANGNVQVNPGNHIPGIPRNVGKIGVEYKVTPRFTIGADSIIVGSQYYIGDPGNTQPQLPSYYVLNAHASYQVTEKVQIFGIINNLTNNKYATYGTFYETGTTGGLVNATLNANNGGDPRAVTVAQPLSVYGGVKVTF